MVVSTFALAKIQPPRARADLVERPQLERAVEAALASHRVTLLMAPAGFGKTVVLVRGLARLPADAARAWVSLDEDDDAARLLACLISALEPYDLPWRTAPDALIAAISGAADARRGALTTFVNTLAVAEVPRGVIVLDDVHRLRDAPTLALIEQLAEWLPANWTLALTSRTEPLLPLARWRARGDLAEFRAADLRFTAAEVAALIRAAPDDARVRELLARTHGWAAGLRLSLSAGIEPPHARSAQSTRRHLIDYLAAEVFETLPADLRSFLLRTSVLPELTAARAAAVSGDARAAQWIDEIERRGLFAAPLEGDEPTLRLHDLFRDFLRERLQRELPDELPALLRRAAADEADPVRRIGWLLRAGALDEAQQALWQSAPEMLAAGADAPLLKLIEQFPPALREGSPLLAFVRGLAAQPRFEWVTMQQSMRRAVEGFAAAGLETQAQQAAAFEVVALTITGRLAEASARLAALRAQPLDRDTKAMAELMAHWESGARGPADEPARRLDRMAELLAAGAPAPVWNRCVPNILFLGRPGMHAALRRWADAAMAIANDAQPLLRAAANVVQGWLLLWRGNLPPACALIESVQCDLRWLGQPRGLHVLVLAYQGACNTLHGDRAATDAAFSALIDGVERDPERRATWRGVYLFLAARCASSLGDWESAQRLGRLLAATPPDREWPYTRAARRALVGRLALHDGDLDTAIAELSAATAVLAEVDVMGTDAVARVALAQALLRARRAADAWRALSPAVEQARNADEPAPFLLAGTDALDEVADADWKGVIDAPAQAALRGWAELARALRIASPAVSPGALPAGLSRREYEVLERIAAGDSNKLIARAFDLSPHTVKRHVANILDKLTLDTRGQAAAWFRDHAGR